VEYIRRRIKNATAAFEQEAMHAAHNVNGPRFAHTILTTQELLGLLSANHSRNANEEVTDERIKYSI
jgi:hypothetical protein